MTFLETKPLPVYVARLIELEADYPMICEWWTAHGWPAVPRDMLPKLGCIVELDGVPKAAAWLFWVHFVFSFHPILLW